MHEKTESAFIRAMTAAKWPTHYFGADSLSGPSRAYSLVGYPSFEAMEKDNLAQAKNPTLRRGVRPCRNRGWRSAYRIRIRRTSVFRDDLSLRSGVIYRKFRYFEILQFQRKAGPQKEWEDMVKMYQTAMRRQSPAQLGGLRGSVWSVATSPAAASFLIFIPMKSLAEIDALRVCGKKLAGSGEGGDEEIRGTRASAISSEPKQSVPFNPKESYPPDEWVKSDSFWKPKPAAAAGQTCAVESLATISQHPETQN